MNPILQGILAGVAEVVKAGIALAESLGQRDAFISALDATLAMVRQTNDRKIIEKHRDPA